MNIDQIEFTKKDNYNLKSDALLIIALFAFLSISIFNQLWFSYLFIIVILAIFLKSKKDYFWMALFFILSTKPGNFFASFSSINNQLPLFNIASGISFATEDLIILAIFLKAISKRSNVVFVFNRPLLVIVLYGFLLLIASFLYDEASIKDKMPLIRNFSSYLLVFALPMLFTKKIEFYKFGYLLLPMTFFVFFTSIYYFLNGDYFVNLFAPNSIQITHMHGGANRLLVHGGGHDFLFFTLVFSIIALLTIKRGNNYFVLTLVFSYLSMIMTATRIWFIVFSLIIITFLLLYSVKSLTRNMVFLIIILFFASSFVDERVYAGMDDTWGRLSSIFTIGDENSQATYTLEDKATTDLPFAIQGFLSNPLFGIGFTSYYVLHGSDDIGNFNLFQEGGVFGFILFVVFWIKIFQYLRSNRKSYVYHIETLKINRIMQVSFLGLLISHFTTNQFFGFSNVDEEVWLLALILTSIQIYLPNNVKTVE